MNEDPYKVCPECGGEYQYTVETCVDCEVPLVFPQQIAERDARELRLSAGLVHLRTAPILWVRALAADLARAGIPYAIDRRKARDAGTLSLYVQRRDLAAAAPFDATYAPVEPAAADREEPESEPDYKVCPSCGGEYRRDVERCADCGAELVEPGELAQVEEEVPSQDAPRETDVWLEYFPAPPHCEIPPSDDLMCLCCGPLPFLTDLSAALDGAGIGHRVEHGPFEERDSSSACIYLQPWDCAAAERISKAATDIDAAAEAPEACPACGASLPRGASICPACRLELETLSEISCSHCGAVLFGGPSSCLNCGVAVASR